MKILVVVSEFPKLTETFAYRNVVEYNRQGCETWIFHIKPFRKGELLHDFVKGLLGRAFSFSYLGAQSILATLKEAVTAPRRFFGLLRDVFQAHAREPKRGLAVLALLPKSIALGQWCKRNGINHIHGEFAGHPANAAMIAARVSGATFSFSAHANDIFVSQAMLDKKANEARFIRAISRFNIDYLNKRPDFPSDKLHLLRCGVPRVMLDAPAPEAPGEDGIEILYVGSLIKKKGVQHLIDALSRMPKDIKWRCRIIGGGDLSDTLKARVNELGLTEQVRFDGPQPAEVVAEANRQAHLLVVPSIIGEQGRVEGIPVVLMEAMAHSRPVIATALSGIPELVEDGQTGWLVPAGEPDAIRDAIVDIASDWPRAARIGQQGRDRIRDEFLIEDNAQALLTMMKENRA